MTDPSFGAAGCAVLIEDDPNQQSTLIRKSRYALVAYGSKTFTTAQIKMSIHAKEFLAIHLAIKKFGRIF